MPSKTDKKPAGMKGGIRRPRGPGGSWSFVIDMGIQDAQRCEECGKREWVGPQRFDACPSCSEPMRDTRERRQVVTGGYDTQTAAKEARAKELVKLGKGSYRPPERMTLAEYLRDRWLPAVERGELGKRLKATTMASYQHHVREHIIGPRSKPFPLGLIQMRKLSLEAIRAHYSMLAEPFPGERDGKPVTRPALGVASRRRIHATLHRALNDAVENGYLDRNPAWRAARGLEAPETSEAEQAAWDAEELSAFLESTAGSPLYPMWHVFAMTGMRRGEVCGLQWGDVDLEAATVTVRRSRVPLQGKVVESSPKTGRIRVVDLDPGTVEVLREMRSTAAMRGVETPADLESADVDPGAYLFLTDAGEPIDPNVPSREFRKAADAAGLPPIPLHGLRHTHATIALQQHVPLHIVSARLGHSNSNVTLRVYTHVLRNDQAIAACTFADAVRSASK
jgi:integrase